METGLKFRSRLGLGLLLGAASTIALAQGNPSQWFEEFQKRFPPTKKNAAAETWRGWRSLSASRSTLIPGGPSLVLPLSFEVKPPKATPTPTRTRGSARTPSPRP